MPPTKLTRREYREKLARQHLRDHAELHHLDADAFCRAHFARGIWELSIAQLAGAEAHLGALQKTKDQQSMQRWQQLSSEAQDTYLHDLLT